MTTDTSDLTNDKRAADLDKLVRKLGQESASSAVARPKMGLAIARARAEGVIGDDDAAKTYDTYLEGRTAALGKSPLAVGTSDNGSYKANVSKNARIIKAAALATTGVDFVGVLERATTIRADMVANEPDTPVKPTFDAYVDLAREQLKQPEAALTDDTIRSVIRKPEAKEKDLIAKLVDDYKRMSKRAEAAAEDGAEAVSDALAPAIEAIAAAIEAAGGEVPLSKEEQKAAEAMSFLASRGYTLVSKSAE